MNCRYLPIIPGVAISLVAIPATGADKSTDSARHPNIVYIMTDDHTAQMMSAYDTRNISTPNLDRIAADGVRFTNSFVANSLSGPSRACMLTGKHSHTNGFRSNETDVFDGSQPTFPKYLQRAGYQTALIGKWHLHTLPTGFDHWEIVPGKATTTIRSYRTDGGHDSPSRLSDKYHHGSGNRLDGA